MYLSQASLHLLWIPQNVSGVWWWCDVMWVAGCDLIIAANFPNLCSGSRSPARRDAALMLPISQIWATFWVSPLPVAAPRQLSRGQIFSKQNCNLNHFSECTQLQLSHHQLIFITTKPVPSPPHKLSNGHTQLTTISVGIWYIFWSPSTEHLHNTIAISTKKWLKKILPFHYLNLHCIQLHTLSCKF